MILVRLPLRTKFWETTYAKVCTSIETWQSLKFSPSLPLSPYRKTWRMLDRCWKGPPKIKKNKSTGRTIRILESQIKHQVHFRNFSLPRTISALLTCSLVYIFKKRRTQRRWCGLSRLGFLFHIRRRKEEKAFGLMPKNVRKRRSDTVDTVLLILVQYSRLGSGLPARITCCPLG